MKKGDDIADDEIEYVVRTSRSQNRVTAILYTEELFISIQYTVNTVALPTYQKGQT
jgi:hypothetical protein